MKRWFWVVVGILLGFSFAVPASALVVRDPDDHEDYSEPVMVRQGPLVIVAFNRTGVSTNHVAFAVSHDGGGTFPQMRDFGTNPHSLIYAQGSDPSVACLGDGTCIVGETTFDPAINQEPCGWPWAFVTETSTDNGTTWHTRRIYSAPGELTDRPYLVADDTNPHGVWAAWNASFEATQGPCSEATRGTPTLMYSDDDGATWTTPIRQDGVVADAAINYAVVNHTVYYPQEEVIQEGYGQINLEQCSTTACSTALGFGSVHLIGFDGSSFPDASNQLRTTDAPYIARNPAGTQLAVAWMQTEDGGTSGQVMVQPLQLDASGTPSFQYPRAVLPYPTAGEQMYPAIAWQSHNVGLCFMQQRPGTRVYDMGCGSSADGGWTWGAWKALSTVDETDSIDYPGSRWYFLGDYFDYTGTDVTFINLAYLYTAEPPRGRVYQTWVTTMHYGADGCSVGPSREGGWMLLLPIVGLLAWRRRRDLLMLPILLILAPTPEPTMMSGSIGGASAVVPLLGDCNGDGRVTIDELVTNVNNALYGESNPPSCVNGDHCPGPPGVRVDCLITMVNNALVSVHTP